MTFLREDAWELSAERVWHPVLLAFALAVRVMQQRPASDPVSWSYQAAVHGARVVPDRFRDQCQHNSWYFLPWHRLYLFWFERTVRRIIEGLPEVGERTKADWALPYWDYGRGPATRALPPAFRATSLPDGSQNPLRAGRRNRGINTGSRLSVQAVSAARALQERTFSVPAMVGVTPGFGGPVSGPNHRWESPFAATGAVELSPHAGVHTQVGGPGGLMSEFDTAPLDPVFWLHHANIDRLWEVWRHQPGRRDPSEPAWRGRTFDFHDEERVPVRGSAQDVLDTVADLGYRYRDTTPPPGPLEGLMAGLEPPGPPDRPAEMVGATDGPVELTGADVAVDVALSQPVGPLGARASVAPGGLPIRVYLNVEDVRADADPGLSYAVYVTVPDGDDLTDDDHHVGTISFFGIERTADLGREHPGGMRIVFDITALHATLRARDAWDDRVRVSFRPLDLEPPDDEAAIPDLDQAEDEPGDSPGPSPVSIGRVSVYYR